MVKVKVAKYYKIWVFSAFAAAWLSGIIFFVLKTWFVVDGEFGLIKHPLQFPALQVHGAAAFVMMVTFGYFLGTHIQHAWKVKPRRILGISLVVMTAFLIMTAYLLYYIAQDAFRTFVGYAHLSVGTALPFILIAHVFSKHSKRKKGNSKNKLKTVHSI